MGLIGSLEELGLADVLQMIGLARKTGLLQLQTRHSAGAIVVREGLVWGACLRDGPSDLRSLLVGCGLVGPAEFDAAGARARREARRTTEVLAERGGPSREEIDAAVREVVEAAVFDMQGWDAGEFRFDLRGLNDPPDPRTMLRSGLSVQYLLMEGARRADEVDSGKLPRERAVHAAAFDPSRPVIAIDSDLSVLEWAKDSLASSFERVHVFQRSELGLARIRQVLARAGKPLLLLSPSMPVDRLTGIEGAADFVRRLRTQAPDLGVVWLCEPGGPRPPAGCPGEGVATRPGRRLGVQSRSAAEASRLLGAELCELVRRAAVRSEVPEPHGLPGFVDSRGAGPG